MCSYLWLYKTPCRGYTALKVYSWFWGLPSRNRRGWYCQKETLSHWHSWCLTKSQASSSSMSWYESFPCIGLFGEVLGKGTALSLSSFVTVYIVGRREVPAKSVPSLLPWVCPPTVFWQPGLEMDSGFITKSLEFSLRGWSMVLYWSNSKLPAGRNVSKAVLCYNPFCLCPCPYSPHMQMGKQVMSAV